MSHSKDLLPTGTVSLKNISDWNTSWLYDLVGGDLPEDATREYQKMFSENELNKEEALELGEEDLEKLGITKMGHRKKILAAFKYSKRKKDADVYW